MYIFDPLRGECRRPRNSNVAPRSFVPYFYWYLAIVVSAREARNRAGRRFAPPSGRGIFDGFAAPCRVSLIILNSIFLSLGLQKSYKICRFLSPGLQKSCTTRMFLSLGIQKSNEIRRFLSLRLQKSCGIRRFLSLGHQKSRKIRRFLSFRLQSFVKRVGSYRWTFQSLVKYLGSYR